MFNCQCSVIYYRNDEKKLTIQAKEEYLLQIDYKSQAKLNSFFGVTNAISDITKNRTANQDEVAAKMYSL